MAKVTIPNNPLTPPVPSSPDNVSSLVSPDVNSTLNKSITPKAFGDQLPNVAISTVVGAASNTKLGRLLQEKKDLIQEGITLEIEHQIILQKLEFQHTPSKKIENGQTVDVPPKLNDEQYAAAVAVENANYEKAKANLQIKKEVNQQAIDEILNDPFKKRKEKKNKRKSGRKKEKTKNKSSQRKARRQKIKNSLASAAKSLAPLVPTLVTIISDKIIEVIIQNGALSKLVDDTNAIIIEANESNDPTKLNNAKLARDNAIRIIQNTENKITKIKDSIQRISIYINIFSAIVQIISAIPIPTSVPPGIGIPINVIMKLVKILDKASRIVAALSAILPILVSALNKVIEELEELKARLLPVNGILEASATSINSSLIDNPNQFGTDLGTYKGFKFALREDTDPRTIVRGFKRHYAVAIDTNNVDVLKSESSYTLDPQDLIETLKIIIDRENLIA